MASPVEDGFVHAAFSCAATATEAGASHFHLLSPPVRRRKEGLAAEDVENAGSEMGETVEDARGFGTVERIDWVVTHVWILSSVDASVSVVVYAQAVEAGPYVGM